MNNERHNAEKKKRYNARSHARTITFEDVIMVLLLLKRMSVCNVSKYTIRYIKGMDGGGYMCVLYGRAKTGERVRGREKYKIYELHTIFSISQIHTQTHTHSELAYRKLIVYMLCYAGVGVRIL